MSTAQAIGAKIKRLPKGKIFTHDPFLEYGSRNTVDRTLSRLVSEGKIMRLARGVFVRPSTNRYVGKVVPNVRNIVKVIAQRNGETVQVHGAEAARRFGLTTQVPLYPVFLTNGPSRTLQVANIPVRLIHTSSRRRLQFAGEVAGVALAALWYLGKRNVSPKDINKIKAALSPREFKRLLSADMPAWMAKALAMCAVDTDYD